MGNAYICRVARKLLGLSRIDSVRDVQFSDVSEAVFAALVDAAVADRFTGPRSETVLGLLEAIRTDPTRCPILADAIEEAGCADVALLEALRTP